MHTIKFQNKTALGSYLLTAPYRLAFPEGLGVGGVNTDGEEGKKVKVLVSNLFVSVWTEWRVYYFLEDLGK